MFNVVYVIPILETMSYHKLALLQTCINVQKTIYTGERERERESMNWDGLLTNLQGGTSLPPPLVGIEKPNP